jgi:hypothetical protein
MSVEKFKDSCYLFNEIAGKETVSTKQDVLNQIKLIQEEVKELYDDFMSNNPVKTLDGLVDVLVTSMGLSQQLENLGFDVDKSLMDTAENNLTKYTKDGGVAAATQEYYERKGVHTVVEFNVKHQIWVVKNKLTNKVLKPVNFESNDLTSCVPETFIEKGWDAL